MLHLRTIPWVVALSIVAAALGCGADVHTTGDHCVDAGCRGEADFGPTAACPEGEPSRNASCLQEEERLACEYTNMRGTNCFLRVVATCAEGTWQHTWPDGSRCGWQDHPDIRCPLERPLEGSSCPRPTGPSVDYEGDNDCAWSVATPCGGSEVVMECASASGFVWTVTTAPSCDSSPTQCHRFDDAVACDAASACRWLEPGCDEGLAPNVDHAGCYPLQDCAAVECATWGTCRTATHDPCWNSPCDACGSETEICRAL